MTGCAAGDCVTLKYDASVDALYASIRSARIHRTVEIDDGTNVDVDTMGRVVGIEVIHPGRIWPLAAILRRYPDITDEDAATLIGACPFAGGAQPMTGRAALLHRIRKGHTMTETATALAKGADYSESHPSIAALKSGGYTFVVRYLSLTPAKNLTAPERDALLGAGIKIALVWETTALRMLGGRDAGKWDGLKAAAEAAALNMTGIPLYFACDFDATPGQQTLINAYLDGVADSIGRDRTGIYGGYWPVSRALNAGKATWAWQTYAWSTFNPNIPMPAHAVKWQIGTHTYFADSRAQLRQGPNGINVGGADCDLDHAYAADFGQYPRPATGPPPPIPDWQVTIMNRLPLVKYGDNDNITGHRWVRRVQGLLKAYGQDLGTAGIDGIYGDATRRAMVAVLASHGVAGDGRQVDRHGWAVLVTGADL